MTQKWYAFKNSSDKSGEVELSIYDEIGAFGIGAKEFIAELREYKGQHVHVRINSPGGEIIDGTAIANALNRHEGGVTVHIDGLAASMASYIAMSGNPTYMSENALMIIHNPWTIASGEAQDLRKQADLLDTMKSALVRGYQRKTGMPAEEISKLMDSETEFTALEAAALGFVDAIEDGIKAVASVSEMRSRFDTFAKRMDESNSVAPEVEVAAPAVEVAVEEAPAAVEAEVAPEVTEETAAEEAAPEASVDVLHKDFVHPAEKIAALEAEKAEAIARAEAAEAELAKVKDAFAALEKSAGVSAATVAPVAKSEESDPVAQWMAAVEAKDFATSNKLYAQHKKAIWAARASLSKATS
jgi:ATP-dependent protease ClpP protease subunit